MTVRDHEGTPFNKFNGLYDRGDKDSVPSDHFTECENVRFIADSSFGTRFGIGISQSVSVPLSNIKRIYNYPTQTGNTIIVLVYDAATGNGKIYHVLDASTVYGPILTINGMLDFAFIPYAGRGYISPFAPQQQLSLAPVSAPGATPVFGTTIENGVHKYAYTFVTATGETTASPLKSVTNGILADPVLVPVIYVGAAGSGNLVAGGSYTWKMSYAIDATHETLLSPVSNTIVAAAGQAYGLLAHVPAEVTFVNIYRTVNGGVTYFREYSLVAKADLDFFSGTPALGQMTDAVLVTQAAAPVANNTRTGAVNLTAIATGPAGTIARKVYRTKADLLQLKLLTTLGDNVTTVYADISADAALGANVPTTNGAVVTGGQVIDRGLQGEFLYVYAGDGTAARKAAGAALTGTMTVTNGAPGHTDPGNHLFGFVSETDTGYLAPPGLLTQFVTSAGNSVSFGSVDVSADPHVVRRHLVASIKIVDFNGDFQGYTYYFVPNATIDNNVDTFLNNISFYDADLFDNASHLFSNYSEIPAGAVLTLYHNRLVLACTFTDISLALVSQPGEPEAINQINGLIVVPLDGNPITNAQELRDVLYMFKRARTVAYPDTGDVPSTWPLTVIDNALGTCVHGIATVLDSGSSSVDFLIIATYQGVSLFNGRFATPELSWKIENYWKGQDRTQFRNIQILNASIQKEIYIVLPSRKLLVGNYANGMDYKAIRWSPWSFYPGINTIAVVNIDEIILGTDLVTP